MGMDHALLSVLCRVSQHNFHAANVCMAGVENIAVHTFVGSTFFSDIQSTALWRAAVGLA